MPPIDKETFSYWVTHPNDLTVADFQQLRDSLATYPYCQALYTLTAKAASMHQRGQTIPFVRQAAAYALSRNALRKLIEDEFQWSDNLLIKLNELSSKQVPIPEDYQHESYALFRNKPGVAGSTSFSLLPFPKLTFTDTGSFTLADTTPPVDDPTLSEAAIRAELALDQQETPAPGPALSNQQTQDNRRRQQLDIIENFIRNEPRIAPVRGRLGEPANQEDLALRSQPARASGGLVTESFAKILCKQGKFDKAIDIYEKLILKNPDKTAYFAAKISELKAGNAGTG